LLITGNYMRPGTGAYPLRGHNNVQGASDHGSMPNMLPGYQLVNDPDVRQRFEAGWKVSCLPPKGLDNHQMVEAIHSGKLKAMYLIGEEMSIVDSKRQLTSEMHSPSSISLSCRTSFFSQTCRYATLCCPELRAWKRKAPSPAQNDASSALSGAGAARGLSSGLEDHARTLRTGWAQAGTITSFRENHGLKLLHSPQCSPA